MIINFHLMVIIINLIINYMGKLPDRLTVTIKTGGLVPFEEKQMDGSYITKKIIYENFIAGIGQNPISLNNKSGNFSYSFDENTFLSTLSIISVSGSPSLKIGTAPNGNDVLDTISISGFQYIKLEMFFETTTVLYFTLSGGVINLRIDLIVNYITIPES